MLDKITGQNRKSIILAALKKSGFFYTNQNYLNMKFILGKKIEMTQRFKEDGIVAPVTVVQAGPCIITQIKKSEKEGYNSVQIGFGEKKKLNKSILGHLKNLKNSRYLREFRVENTDKIEKGKNINVTTFVVGDLLNVIGISKGKGFQGVVKRHGFGGSKATHGNKDQLRMPGSIGATDASRVFKGKRMGGHMGDERISVKNLELIEIDAENNLLFIKGALPGARNGLLMISAEGDLTFVENKPKEIPTEEKIEVKKENEFENKKPASENTKEDNKEEEVKK